MTDESSSSSPSTDLSSQTSTSQSAGFFDPVPELTVTTLETLKVFSDPLRQQIIEALKAHNKTVKQIALELELAPTKLYYHVNLLEAHKLIRVTDTRIVSGIIEKQYRASAYTFKIQRSLMSSGDGENTGLATALDALLDPLRADIMRGAHNGTLDLGEHAPINRRLKVWRALSRLSEQDAQAFYEKLEALLQEYQLIESEQTDDPIYSLMISFFPYSKS